MSKKAFIFPGQGAQYVGMAKDFYENNTISKEVFNIASETLHIDMAKLCFVENDELNLTEFTQAAMVTACVSILKVIEDMGLKADITAGLSLGEYAALVCNKVLNFEQAVKLVRTRGILMANEVPKGVGTMAAILGMNTDELEKICKEVSLETNLIVEPANYNCPGQIVISGEKSAVLKAMETMKKNGAKRVMELNVSGPFHSSMLKGAGEKLAKELESVKLGNIEFPYVNNVTADITTSTENTKTLLEKQVYSPVRFMQSVENMINFGVDTFIEIGPGRTLSGFIKKIDRTKKVINIDKLEDLEKLNDIQ